MALTALSPAKSFDAKKMAAQMLASAPFLVILQPNNNNYPLEQ